MKITVKVGILFAFIWMMVKISFLGMGKANEMLVPAVMTNIFLLLSSISVGLYLTKRKEIDEESSALKDVKNGMTSGLIYAILVSTFMYLYYAKIDTEFNRHQITESEMWFEKQIKDPKALNEIRSSNEAFETMTITELRKHYKKNIKANFSPLSTSTVGLLAMLLLGTLNSIFVTAVYRKIVFSKKALK